MAAVKGATHAQTATDAEAIAVSAMIAAASRDEARINQSSNVLVVLAEVVPAGEPAVSNFFGTVVLAGAGGCNLTTSTKPPRACWEAKTVYLCGDIASAVGHSATTSGLTAALTGAGRVFVVRELSSYYGDGDGTDGDCGGQQPPWPMVGVGRVPIMLHGAGVLFRRFFGPYGVNLNGATRACTGVQLPTVVKEGRCCGDDQDNNLIFDRVSREHKFQYLTESNKQGRAHRTGIYLTDVREDMGTGDRHFRLLRCSTNLSGPTDNFKATDRAVVDALNMEAIGVGGGGDGSGGSDGIFDNAAPLNHVLAQIYWNTPATATSKMTKARIAAHADKTKDMPGNGIMAFCTFYSGLEEKLQPITVQSAGVGADPFDWGYRGRTSGLTRLQFRLKKCVAERYASASGGKEGIPAQCPFVREFCVPLYPNSVFFMSLSTNRLYTHEIRPPTLKASQIPTRLGYVVRCSSSECVSRDGRTLLKIPVDGNTSSVHASGTTLGGSSSEPTGLGGNEVAGAATAAGGTSHSVGKQYYRLVELQPQTPAGVRDLRNMYRLENSTDGFIDYGHRFLFSMNRGDYSRPGYSQADEFRQYTLPLLLQPSHAHEANVADDKNDTGRRVWVGDNFEILKAAVRFEGVCKGRQGTVLVEPDVGTQCGERRQAGKGIPIVRTTTKYDIPAQCFEPAPTRLARAIEVSASLPPRSLNNALVELYDNSYTKMGFHTDQAQDLAAGSQIAVYSCYEHPEQPPTRKLVIQAKETPASLEAAVVAEGKGGATPPNMKAKPFELVLRHNSVVVWSLDTNRRFVHKIVLDLDKRSGRPTAPENRWLGFTFRTSGTFVRKRPASMVAAATNGSLNDAGGGNDRELEVNAIDELSLRNCMYFEDGTPLTMADAQQQKEFYKLRGRENKETDFIYPPLTFTISQSDLMSPVTLVGRAGSEGGGASTMATCSP